MLLWLGAAVKSGKARRLRVDPRVSAADPFLVDFSSPIVPQSAHKHINHTFLAVSYFLKLKTDLKRLRSFSTDDTAGGVELNLTLRFPDHVTLNKHAQ